jgi:hypothetical protein
MTTELAARTRRLRSATVVSLLAVAQSANDGVRDIGPNQLGLLRLTLPGPLWILRRTMIPRLQPSLDSRWWWRHS